jgi:hypothetical protein
MLTVNISSFSDKVLTEIAVAALEEAQGEDAVLLALTKYRETLKPEVDKVVRQYGQRIEELEGKLNRANH